MAAATNKSNIWNHWQPIVAIASFLIAMGGFYSETRTMKKDISNLEARQDRQFQLIQSQGNEIGKLREDAAYQKGLHESIKHQEK